eukprot:13878752-Alexandrium_andersonii.AAC.1
MSGVGDVSLHRIRLGLLGRSLVRAWMPAGPLARGRAAWPPFISFQLGPRTTSTDHRSQQPQS